jgi:hypothetical protein
MAASSFWERTEEKEDRARVAASRLHMDSESTEKDGVRGRKARYTTSTKEATMGTR